MSDVLVDIVINCFCDNLNKTSSDEMILKLGQDIRQKKIWLKSAQSLRYILTLSFKKHLIKLRMNFKGRYVKITSYHVKFI